LVFVWHIFGIALGNEIEEVLRYRYWFAPLDKISNWPLNDERYVPMRRDLFNDLINSLNTPEKNQNNTEQIKIIHTTLNAKLNGTQLINGKGYIKIETTTNPQQNKTIELEPWKQWINLNNTQNIFDNNITQQHPKLVHTNNNKTLILLPNPTTTSATPTTPANQTTQTTPTNPTNPTTSTNLKSSENLKPSTNFLNPVNPTTFDLNNIRNKNSTQQIYFDWSLRGKTDPQGKLQFDLAFPRSTQTELNIELPPDKILTCPSAIVIEEKIDPNIPANNWKILTGSKNNISIIIANKNTPQSKKLNTAYQQSVLYNISTSGLEVTATLLFDQNDPAIDYIEVELDSPLVPVAIHSGGVTISPSFLEQIDHKDHILIRIDMSEIEPSRRHEITLAALAPIVTGDNKADVAVNNNIWKLPRIKATSKNLFWKETRCSLIIQRPLQTRNLLPSNCTQVRPVTDTSRSLHDTFELKYFAPDAQIGINVYQEESRYAVETFTQIQMSDDAINGNAIAAIKATEGQRFTFAFPVSPHWAIHSVKGISNDEILSWDIIPAKDMKLESNRNLRNNNIESYLSLQLKKPLAAGDQLRIQVTGRFLTDPHREFKLVELSPLLLSLQKNESHFVAVQTDLPSKLQYRLQDSALFEIRDLTDAKLQQLFIEQPEGVLLPLDVRTQELAFKIGRTRPDYNAAITEKIKIGTYNSNATFTFNIKPRESAIERIYVYIIESKNTPPNETIINNRNWQWNITNGSTRPDIYRTENPQIIQTRIIKGREIDEFIAALADKNLPEKFDKGDLWEIRLATPQNIQFEISATKPITTNDEIIVPVAILPAAQSQHGEIYIESTGQFPYAILPDNLKSIPTDISNRQLNRNIRAAFRFEPADEIKRLDKPALKLQRINKSELPPEAWIWLMKLESQYDLDGAVRNCANFYIENRSKESLRIILPDGVKTDDVEIIWINNKQSTWQSISTNTLALAIPESERYITASIEYSYKNYNQKTITQIIPQYPKIDIPVLSKNCIVWFHPDYKIIKSTDKLKASNLFESDITNFAKILPKQNKNRLKAIIALQSFTEWSKQTTNENSDLTWQMLADGKKNFTELLLQNIRNAKLGDETYDASEVKFYVDASDGTSRGILTKPITSINEHNSSNLDNDLTIFISVKQTSDGRDEYSIYFTSLQTAGVFQYFNGQQINNQSWFAENDEPAKYIANDETTTTKKIHETMPSANINKPQMITITDWINAAPKTQNINWQDINQSFRKNNIAPDWNACEISGTDNVTYFIVRYNLLKYYYLTTLLIVVLTCKCRFVNPILLIITMIASQTAYYFLPITYSIIAEGIFTGAAITLIFILIRKNITPKNKITATNTIQTKNTEIHYTDHT
jgi:hypothetical protein